MPSTPPSRRKQKGPRTLIEERELPFADPEDVVELAETNVIPIRARVEREPSQLPRPVRSPTPGPPPGSRRRPLPRTFSTTTGVARAPAARSSTRFTERSALKGIDAPERTRWLEIAGSVAAAALILLWMLLAW